MLLLLLACSPDPAPDAPTLSSPGGAAVEVPAEPPTAEVGGDPSEADPTPPPPEPAVPAYESRILPLSETTRAAILEAGTWKEGCPVGLDALSELRLSHHGLDGQVHQGLLIVNSEHAQGLSQVFGALFEAGFVIQQMKPAYAYGGDDDAMMADNNTSAFNCRPVSGGSRYSEHSFGHALDLNPLWNPYVRGGKVMPPGGADYLDREADLPGLVHADGLVVKAFAEIGWGWGGTWKNSKDYQHFSATGK